MKRPTLLIAAAFAALAGCATTAIEDSQLGLSKSSVFDTTTPAPFGFEGPGAGQSAAPLAGSGMRFTNGYVTGQNLLIDGGMTEVY